MFRFAQHDKIPCVIASEQRERGNQQAKNPHFYHSETAFATEKSQNTRTRRNVSLCPATIGGAPLAALIYDSACAAETAPPPTSLRGESCPTASAPLYLLHFAPIYDKIVESRYANLHGLLAPHSRVRLCENSDCRA